MLTTLDPYGFPTGGRTGRTALWPADQTRALLVPVGRCCTLSLRFQGNIGAETACITTAGASVSETATTSPFTIAPIRFPPA